MKEGQFIVFTNTGNGLPIAEFELSDGPVCADHSIHGMSEEWKPHELEITDKWGVCITEISNTWIDPWFTKIDSVKESTLYQDNGVASVISSLPYF